MDDKNQNDQNKIRKEEILKFDMPTKLELEIKPINEAKIPITFSYHGTEITKPMCVQICGSFDKWQVRHPLTYDPLQNKWSVTLKIKKGSHNYKYIVDGEWFTSNIEKTAKDVNGFFNNVITL